MAQSHSSWMATARQTISMWWGTFLAAVRNFRFTPGVFFALFCVGFVIVGNIMLLIATNFFLLVFLERDVLSNSGQLAVQVVVSCFLCCIFLCLSVAFVIWNGWAPVWRVLTATNRMRGPLYRLWLLFCSGATNGLTGVLSIYAMAHTPVFIQAVLLCAIPFSAQAWTYIFIPEERQRKYLSVWFIGSFVLFAGGVLLSSLSAFLDVGHAAREAPWSWTLIYLLSSVLFGLWCVVQRLYLDAIALVPEAREGAPVVSQGADREPFPREVSPSEQEHQQQQEVSVPAPVEAAQRAAEEVSETVPLTTATRKWADLSVDTNAGKVVLLLLGVFFQLLVTVVAFPVDAIPWYGGSATALDAWKEFSSSIRFAFDSWHNIRFGLLYTLGIMMSFVGCAYLNEHSPTLSSIVLQLAGPISGLVIVIVPQWDAYHSGGHVGQQIGGVILLILAAIMYHVWEQMSMKALLRKRQKSTTEDDGGLISVEVGKSSA